MEQNTEKLKFDIKRSNIKSTLSMMAENRLISPSVKTAFIVDLWKARTVEELQDITTRLARICEGRGEKGG